MTLVYEEFPGEDAAPLVFLHGFLGQPSCWRDVHRALEPARCAASLQLPGHGLMPVTPRQESFEAVVDVVAASIPFEQKYWIVGYSLGARMALSLALRHPERVAGAVLVGCHPGLRTEAERAARIADDEAAAQRLLQNGVESFVHDWEALPLFESQSNLPMLLRERHRQRRLKHTPAGLAWALRTLSLGRMPPTWKRLEECPFPIHMVTGERDAKFTALARELVALTPQITHDVVPGAGHDVTLEAPSALAEIIGRTIDTRSTHDRHRVEAAPRL